MKEKKIVMYGLSFIFLLFLISFSSAAVGNATLTLPAASTTYSGTVILNTTTANQAGNFTCSFYGKSLISANSSWSILASAVNNTASGVNTTFDSVGIEDANDYSVNVTCANNTNTWTPDVHTGITIDNTIPQAPTLSPSTNTLNKTSGTYTFTGDVTDANTTSCTYLISRGGAVSGTQDSTTGSATYSAASCTFTKTFSNSKDNGDWYWYITASDGSNTTQSATNILQVQIAPSGGTSPIVANQLLKNGKIDEKTLAIASGEKENNYNIFLIIIGVVIASIVIYFLIRKR